MNKQSDFDLHAAVSSWRENLSQSPGIGARDVDELESHLRDSMARLQEGGLSTEEAFLIAARRLGTAADLGVEYCKVNHGMVWLNRALWALIGIQTYGLIAKVAGLAGDGIAIGGLAVFGYKFTTGNNESFFAALPTVLLTSVQLLALVGTVACVWWLFRRNESRISRLFRRPAWVAGVAAGFCMLMLLLSMARSGEVALLGKWFSKEAVGTIVFSAGITGMILNLTQIIALAALTVFIIRRKLRAARRTA